MTELRQRLGLSLELSTPEELEELERQGMPIKGQLRYREFVKAFNKAPHKRMARARGCKEMKRILARYDLGF